MRIDLAHCVDIGRVVDIQQACTVFAGRQDRRVTEFDFICSDPECRKAGVRVTAVNNWRVPEESLPFKSPHFRLLDKNHHPNVGENQTDVLKPAIALVSPDGPIPLDGAIVGDAKCVYRKCRTSVSAGRSPNRRHTGRELCAGELMWGSHRRHWEPAVFVSGLGAFIEYQPPLAARTSFQAALM